VIEARFRIWWHKIRPVRIVIAVTAAIIVIAIALIIVGYSFDWSGFNGYTQVSTIHTLSGPTAGTVTRTEVYQPGKTLWDWLQLLIVPVMLAIGLFWLNQLQKGREERTTEERAKVEREIASDNQREAALKEYIDKMSELLLHENLRKSEPEDEVRKIARVRTLTVLPRLDRRRKGSVLQFLHESGLIDKDKCIIDLSGADLRDTDLRDADLGGASLNKANLCGAILNDTILINTDLNEANLSRASLVSAALSMANLYRADMSNADLRDAALEEVNLYAAKLEEANLTEAIDITVEKLENEAKSLKGATMPDGSIHSQLFPLRYMTVSLPLPQNQTQCMRPPPLSEILPTSLK
jgi:uncharacterized protein YjbI with pentapeptide repeats